MEIDLLDKVVVIKYIKDHYVLLDDNNRLCAFWIQKINQWIPFFQQ
jgi:hypothetical protein